MSFLNAVINEVKDEELREALQDRLDIVRHKIKFMDAVPVVCLDKNNLQNYAIEGLLLDAGGILQDFAANAQVVIYLERDTSMIELMGTVPALLENDWPAVTYNRVYLMDGVALDAKSAEAQVAVLENLAEILYPGYFVFGNEGIDWISFRTQ